MGDLRSGNLLKRISIPLSRKRERPAPSTGFDHLAISSDSLLVAAVLNSSRADWSVPGVVDTEPTTLHVCNVARGKERARIVFKAAKGKMPQLTCLAFLRDGRTLAAGYLDDADVHLIEAASGQQRAVLHGHQGVVRSLAVSPDGHHLLSGSEDTTILVWDLDELLPEFSRSDKVRSAKELKQLWADLASADASEAFRAIETLRRCPQQSLTLLREKVRPRPSVQPERIQQLIRDLDSEEFEVRNRAMKGLEQLAEIAEPALQKALEKPPSLEARLRLKQLLEAVNSLSLSADRLRLVRTVEVLEAIGSPEARDHLQRLSGGAAKARLTCEAKESLRRLASAC